ncbi:putative transcriptional activator ChrR, partial [Vibrio parahaemolyticus AQ3810]
EATVGRFLVHKLILVKMPE